MSGFSDPKWWPQPPPAAPKHISRGAVFMRGVLPLIAIAAVAVFVILSERQHNAAAARTQAAYAHCLATHGAKSASATVEGVAVADCASIDPAAATSQRGQGGPFAARGNANSQLGACVLSALRSSGGLRGAFSHDDPSAIEAAQAACASILAHSHGHPTPAGASSTAGTPPPKL
jgi:hypothetical protein